MSDENEEFEFRLRAEREKAAAAQPSMVSNVLKGVEDVNPVLQISRRALHGIDTASQALGGAATDAMAAQSGRRGVLNPLGVQIPPEVSGGVGAAANMLPGMLLGGGGGRAAVPLLQREGKDWMLSALKPTKLERMSGDAERAAQTMLDEGVNVTDAGVAKLRDKVGTLNDELQTALNSSPATVDKSAIATRLQKVIADIENTSFTPQQRVKAVEKIYNDVLGNAAIPNQIPVALANKIKSGIYKELGDLKFKRMRSGDPITDAETAQAALAKGAKEEIAAAVPSAEPLNAEMSKLIRASNTAENAATAFKNTNPGGLSWLTHDLPTFVSMLVARHPASKSIIARALYGSDVAAPTIGAGVGGSAEAVKNEIEKRGRR